ncbi:MAG: DUF1343 domain-containing protein [Spirochaetes bacterium]|nr:DUF1343 domain-containing protein [Spirochaetota bacterium]MBN2769177.1 DUF1343 domain-containing protein [Spirochaetota bacterium]
MLKKISVYIGIISLTLFACGLPVKSSDKSLDTSEDKAATVRTGLDILSETNCKKLKTKKVALVTNMTAVNNKNIHIVDIMKTNDIKIVKIFTPEHGFSAKLDTKIENDKLGTIPLLSLYGKRRKLDPKELSDVDIVVFDIQTVGARYYTYKATLVYIMQAAANARKKLIVLDRPNPAGGVIVSGFMPQKGLTDRFTSIFPFPIRPGMTIGELALMFNKEHNINCNLEVIAMQNWKRSMLFSDTNLPWHNPSPNINREEAAILYNGLGWLETTNISMARGTDLSFEMMGAPYIDSSKLIKKIGKVSGAVLKPVSFIPKAEYHKHYNKRCFGIQISMTDKRNFDPFPLGLKIYKAMNELYPEEYISFSGLKTSSGRHNLKSDIQKKSIKQIIISTKKEINEFMKIRKKYLLY